MGYNPDSIIFHEYGTPKVDRRTGKPFQLSKTADNPYHVLVYPDGSVRYRNPKDPYGYKAPHARGSNPNAIGISYAGPVGGKPTPAGLKALQDEARKANDWMKSRGVKNPKWWGHGEAYKATKDTPQQASKSGRDIGEGTYYKDFGPRPTTDQRGPRNMQPPGRPEETFRQPDDVRADIRSTYAPEPQPATPPVDTSLEGVRPEEGVEVQGFETGDAFDATGLNTTAVPFSLQENNEVYDFEGPQGQPRYAVEEKFRSQVPAYPRTPEEAKNFHEQRAAQFADQVPPTWWETAQALEGNALYGLGVWGYNATFNENFDRLDPDFEPDAKIIAQYPKEAWDVLALAPNQLEFDRRRARLDVVKKTADITGRMSTSGWLLFEGGNLLLEMPVWIGLSYATGGIGTVAGVVSKTAMQTRRMALARAFGGATAATFPEMLAYNAIGEVSAEGVVYGTLLGGALGGSIDVGLTAIGRSRAEAIERFTDGSAQVVHRVQEAKDALPEEAPRTKAEDEVAVHGDVKEPEPVVDTVVRTQDDEPGKTAAMANQDYDTIKAHQPSMRQKMSPEVEAAIDRQAYQGDSYTLYVPRDKDGKLANFGYRKAADSEFPDLVEVRVPKRALRYETDGPTLGPATGKAIYLSDGKFNVTRKPGKNTTVRNTDNLVSREGHSYIPNKNTPGTKRIARANKLGSKESLSEAELRQLDEGARKGETVGEMMRRLRSEAEPGAGSGGSSMPAIDFSHPAARPGLSQMSRAVKNIVADDGLVPDRANFVGRGFMISRGMAMANSPNKVVRVLAYRLFPGLASVSSEALKKIERTLTPMEIKERLQETWTGRISDVERLAYREALDDYKANRAAWVKDYYREILKTGEFNAKWLTSGQISDLINVKIARAMREKYDEGFFDDATPSYIIKAADQYHKIGREILETQADPGVTVGEKGQWLSVQGADEVLEALNENGNTHWLPRVWSYAAIQRQQQFFNDGQVLHDFLYRNMIVRLEGDGLEDTITDDVLRKVANAMADTIHKSKGGWNTWVDVMNGKASVEEMVALLRAYNKTADPRARIGREAMDEIKEFMKAGKKSAGNRSGKHFRRRGLLDETAKIKLKINGREKDLELSDFLENNASVSLKDYAVKSAGRAALATFRVDLKPDLPPGATGSRAAGRWLAGGEHRVKDEAGDNTGEILKKGIRSDTDWEELMEKVGEGRVAGGVTEEAGQLYNDEWMLTNYYQVQTHTYPAGKTHEILDFLRAMGNIRYLGNAMFPQIGESINIFAHGGWDAAQRILSGKQFWENLKNTRVPSDADSISALTRMIEGLGFYGNDLKRMMVGSGRLEETGNFVGAAGGDLAARVWRETLYKTRRMEDFVLTYSGLLPSTGYQTMRLIEGLNDQFYGWATKYRSYDRLPKRHKRTLENAGLTPELIDSAFDMVRDPNVTKTRKGVLKRDMVEEYVETGKFNRATMTRLQHAFARQATEAIQHNKWDQLPPGWDNPWVKTVFQLQSFMIGSFTNQLVQNSKRGYFALKDGYKGIKGGDNAAVGDALMELGAVGTMTIGQMMFGAVMYIALQETINQGLSDEQVAKRRQDLYDWDNLALAAVSRSGFLGSVPFLYDSVAQMFDAPAFGGYRSSGLGSGLMNIPATGLIKDVGKAGKAVYEMATGDPDTDDARAIGKVISNHFMFDIGTQIAAREIFGLDEASPKDKRDNVFTPFLGDEE